MGKTREIKKRIKAVGNIRRITKTMQMIATSKFARSQQRAVASKPYSEGIFALVRQLASAAGESAQHPLLTGPASVQPGVKELTLVVTSDRGLAGPYNSSVLRAAMGLFRSTPSARAGEIDVVGKKGIAFMRFSGIPVAMQHQIGDKPTFEAVARVAERYMDRYIAGEISVVRVVSMRYISAGKQAPEVFQLLPLTPPKTAARSGATDAPPSGGIVANYEFSPDAGALLGDLLPAAVRATLFQIFNDAVVSEHVARMVAMKAATDNAGKMRRLLTREYNRARQAQITTELTEIISGAAALT